MTRRLLLALTAALVVGGTAGIALVARRAPRPPPLSLRLEVEAAPPGTVDVASCRVGDTVVVDAVAATALWVFRGETLIAVCPGAGCAALGDRLRLSFTPSAAVRHRVIAVAGPATLRPTGTFDEAIIGARAAGARLALRSVVVEAP